MLNRGVIVAVATLFATGAVFAQPAKKDGEKQPAKTVAPTKITPAPAPSPKAAPATLKVGDPAPPLTVDSFIKGEAVSSLEKGKVYVVEFWATWCPPCIDSIPHLSDLQRKNKDIVFIGIAGSERLPEDGKPDNRLKDLNKFVKKMGGKMQYRVAYDSKRAMSAGWMQPAAQTGIPTAFLVDAEGKIAFIGHPSDLEAAIAAVKGKPTEKPKSKTKSKG